MKISDIRDLDSARDHARKWLFEYAAPLWSTAGFYPDGMFAERLDLSGRPVDMPRRLRVQARQIYSFCAIGALGWDGPWRDMVSRAVDVFISRGRRQADGLFVHLFDNAGEVVNSKLDLYDHAFGLFALAHAGKLLNRPALFEIAGSIQDVLDREWSRPEGGFWEGELTLSPPYRQNPHMHMFEAALANYNATGNQRWLDIVDHVGNLFRSRFWHRESGAVTEYFDQNWARLPGDEGSIVEPGHCLEWAWLFEVGFENDSGAMVSDGLTKFARAHGICPDRGVLINEVRLDGLIKDGGARLWPQTERLKAAMSRYRRTSDAAEAEEAVNAYLGLIKYFDTPVMGVWRDRLNPDGTWVNEDAPASSFYHIVCALTELLS